VAGGMGGSREDFPRETLDERVANTRARQAGRPGPSESAGQTGHSTAGFHRTPPPSWGAPPTPPATPSSPLPLLRHCWYDGPFGRQPALLLRWRNISGHFDGLIVVAAPDQAGTGWAVVEMWTDAAMLSPA
jgi:hypothetical protein